VKSRRSASGSCTERADVTQSGRTGNGMLPSLNGRLL
jgi:hypothetical protein